MVARLAVMMFLETWPLGVWIVTIGTYIGAHTGSAGDRLFDAGFIGYCGAAAAIGGAMSPALAGMLSDRLFAAQRVLVVLHLLAGIALATVGYSGSRSQIGLFFATLVYFQLYAPTVTMTTTIAMRNVRDVDRDYPPVRVAGTLAWVAAGWFVGLGWPALFGSSIEATLVPVWIGVVGHGVMAAYSLTLPDTPPARTVGLLRTLTGGSELWSNRAFVTFLAISVLACVPPQAYDRYANLFLNNLGYEHAAAKLTIGQVTEVFCLFAMPMLLRRFGLRVVFMAGVLTWTLRFFLLAAGAAWGTTAAIYLAIFVHGPCYAFVYVTGQLYIDRLATRDNRGAAQGLHAVATTGMGHLIGSAVVGGLQHVYLTPPGVDPAPYRWEYFWLAPGLISLVAAGLFWALFREDRPAATVQVHAEDLPPSPAEQLIEPME
ncbi:MFS transporter [Botrimarina hoheduenensis]|nr:MFS transporter [Botrimarina hoheduenensis]